IGIRYTETGVFRSEIRELQVPVLSKRFSNGEVSLLRISGSIAAIGAENPLSRSGVRIRWRDLYCRPAGQCECRVQIVRRLLADGLNERELRNGKRRRDARLFEKDDAVSRANHPAVSYPVRQPQARTEVAALESSRSVREIENLRT